MQEYILCNRLTVYFSQRYNLVQIKAMEEESENKK